MKVKISLLLLPLMLTGCQTNSVIAENESEIVSIGVDGTNFVKDVNLKNYKAEPTCLTVSTESNNYIYNNYTYYLVYKEENKPSRISDPIKKCKNILIEHRCYQNSRFNYYFDVNYEFINNGVIVKEDNYYFCFYNYGNITLSY